MTIPMYLAQTPWEFTQNSHENTNPAWMSCRFSPSHTGLIHIPQQLPENTLLILDDMTPPQGHDADLIRSTLSEIIGKFRCSGILLDFQRPDRPESLQIIEKLLSLPCPVIVSDIYAKELDAPVFLPPIPPCITPEEYCTPWKNRKIYLEIAIQTQTLTLTEHGCQISDCSYKDHRELPHFHPNLCCHYGLCLSDSQATFTLYRSKEDNISLLSSLEQLGVKGCVGLYQDFK